jgi:hypothetical protein
VPSPSRPGEHHRAGPDGPSPIEDFWAWWAGGGHCAAKAGISGAGFEGFTEQMTTRVEAIHPDLEWELAPGTRADHALVVSAGGVPDRRRLSERWYQQAPAASPTWEYHPARQPSLSSLQATLQSGDARLDLTQLTFELHVDNDRQVIDTVVFHPAFPALPQDVRVQVGFLALDWALGEDGVIRWIGRFEAAGAPPAAGVPAAGLVEVVEALAGRARGSRWALLRGERDGRAVVAVLAAGQKWIDHPLLDLHITVTLPYADQTPAGLPAPDSLGQLRDFEEGLTGRLPPHALVVAHESGAGVRTLHVYGDSDDLALVSQVRDLVSRWRGAAVSARPDAGWRDIRHLTG